MYTEGLVLIEKKVYATWRSYQYVTNMGARMEVLSYTGGANGAWRPSSPSKEDRLRPYLISRTGEIGRSHAGYTYGVRQVIRL